MTTYLGLTIVNFVNRLLVLDDHRLLADVELVVTFNHGFCLFAVCVALFVFFTTNQSSLCSKLG